MQTLTETQEAASELVPAAPDFLSGYISEEEYAQSRGVTVRTCQRDRQLRKAPPYIQLGRRTYYRIESAREWLLKNERLEAKPNARTRSWAGRRS